MRQLKWIALLVVMVVTSRSEAGVRFEPHLGQMGGFEDAHFVARAESSRVGVGSRGIEIQLGSGDRVRLRFDREAAAVSANGRLVGITNYVRGRDPAGWRLGVPGYAEAILHDVAPGVDVRVHARDRVLEFDLVVSPPVTPERLAGASFVIEGAARVCEGPEGTIRLDTEGEAVELRMPEVFQELEGRRESLSGQMLLVADRTVGFDVRGYDRDASVVIDPTWRASTYLGGSEIDGVSAVALDASGYVIVAGSTRSANFPTASAWQPTLAGENDMFVARLSRDLSSVLTATYLGGSDYDGVSGVAVDTQGRILLAGVTSSSDFPVLGAPQPSLAGWSDGAIVLLSSGLTPLASTYLGGGGTDNLFDVTLTPAGEVVVVGVTDSTDLPVVQPLQEVIGGSRDGLVAKYSGDLGQVLATSYFGGDGNDEIAGVVTDSIGRVYVTGGRESYAYYDALMFVTKFDSGLTRVVYDLTLSTGGGYDIALDGAGNAYVAGGDFCQQCYEYPLVVKVDPNGQVVWGSRPFEGGVVRAISVDSSGRAYVVGTSYSYGPGTPEICSPLPAGGGYDAFVARLGPSGRYMDWLTPLGGSDRDYGWAVALDGNGRVWIGGSTRSVDFPVKGPFQAALGGVDDGFVVRLGGSAGASAVDFVGEPRVLNRGGTVWFESRVCEPDDLQWDLGDGTTSASQVFDHYYSYQNLGTFDVSLTATRGSTSGTETKLEYIAVIDASGDVDPSSGLPPLTVQLNSSLAGPVTGMYWDLDDGTTSPDPNPTHTYLNPGYYCPEMVVSTPAGDYRRGVGCVDVMEMIPDFSAFPRIGTAPLPVTFQNLTQGVATSFLWDFGDGTTSTAVSPVHVYPAVGSYTVRLQAVGPTQVQQKSVYGYIEVTPQGTADLVLAPGPDPSAPPRIGTWDSRGAKNPATDILAYGTGGFGANVAAGDVEVGGAEEILTGPGPGVVYGPQVRCFRVDSSSLARVNFFAYGTLKFGVNPAPGELDGDAGIEILTGAGPGAVFGPHVRGFEYDGTLGVLPGCSFYAYQTLRYGVNVAAGTIGTRGPEQILTGPGPGPSFGAVVGTFAYDPPVASLFSFQALSAAYGVRVSAGDVDLDGWAELMATPGPGVGYGSNVGVFDLDGSGPALTELIAVWSSYRGASTFVGDLTGDGQGELGVTPGPDPTAPAYVRAYEFTGSSSRRILDLDDLLPWSYGLRASSGDLGF